MGSVLSKLRDMEELEEARFHSKMEEGCKKPKEQNMSDDSAYGLKAFDLPSVDTSERAKDILSSRRYHDIKNAIGMEIQMSKRMEALEYIMEAYPSSYTLKEIKDQLEYVMMKNDKEIRELMKACQSN